MGCADYYVHVSHMKIAHSWWRHQMETCSALLALCEGHRWILRTKASDAELWCFFFICAWINGWINNRESSNWRRHRAHYVVTVMPCWYLTLLNFAYVRIPFSTFLSEYLHHSKKAINLLDEYFHFEACSWQMKIMIIRVRIKLSAITFAACCDNCSCGVRSLLCMGSTISILFEGNRIQLFAPYKIVALESTNDLLFSIHYRKRLEIGHLYRDTVVYSQYLVNRRRFY